MTPEPLPTTDRRAFLALSLASLAALDAPSAALAAGPRDAAAEQFVQTGAQRVISVLADRGQTDAQRLAAFRRALDDLADVGKITNFVLGKYARTISPAQRAQFTTVFKAYAERVYRNRLDDYHGETLKVTGSLVRKPGDVVVNTLVAGGKLSRPAAVSWRVLGDGATWKVVDVQFKGVWLAITQQQDFVSTIDNAGGDVGVLIAQLQRDAQRPAPG